MSFSQSQSKAEKISVQNKKLGCEEATKWVSVFLFQAFDVLWDCREKNGEGNGEGEQDGAVG